MKPSTPVERRRLTRIDSGRPGARRDRIAQALILGAILSGLTGLIGLCCWGALGRV